jgi:hypothetical protein
MKKQESSKSKTNLQAVKDLKDAGYKRLRYTDELGNSFTIGDLRKQLGD